MHDGLREKIRCAVGELRPASGDMLSAINAITGATLTADDVYVRSGAVCNDQINYNSSRFTLAALNQIVTLFNAGQTNWHRQHDVYSSDSGLPLGRAFKAVLEPMPGIEGGNQVRVWWYYLKGDDEGDTCERYIRAGIWRELSISCWVRSYTTNVDGMRIGYGDGCSPFYPGQVLPDGRTVIGIMDDVTELEEFSLVSRGAEINTTIEGAEVQSTLHAVALARNPRREPEDPARAFARFWTGDQGGSR